MKQYILIIIAALLFSSTLHAQDTMSQPVDVGSKASSFTYTDTKNTTNFNNDFGQGSKDVFYKFTLTQTMDVKISHCDSELWDTYVHLLDVNGNLIDYNDDDWEFEYCSNPMNSFLNMNSLPAGTYYVVSEGYSQNGNITTTIQGVSPMDIYSQDIGFKASSFTFTDTKNTVNTLNSYTGQGSNDVFYKFTLTRPMDVLISHCGSEVFDTYVHLLGESGNLIDENDDDWEYEYCGNAYNSFLHMSNLPAGTYYVVSEGYSDNGNITTTIEGIRPFEATNQNTGLDPSTDQNYILTITPTVATADVSNLSTDQSLQTIQYFDGLGRPIQTVQRNITPQKKDIVSSIQYDGVGREYMEWLPTPMADNQGAFVNLNEISNIARNVYADSRPFNETIFESSPLNRVTGQKGAGSAWNTHSTNISYQTNGTEVANFIVNNNNQLERTTNYSSGMLYKTISTDEDGKIITEYKDKLGQVVMKQSSTDVRTYFVYNDLGQLSYVIPPIAADSLPPSGVITDNNGVLKRYAYLYKYDERGNCIYKRLPGCTPIYMIYDKADRLVLSQDGNQRKNISGAMMQWTAMKYDRFGRGIFTGVMYRSEVDSTLIYKSIRDIFMNELVVDSYTANNFNNCTPLTVNYYDNYSFISSLPTNKQSVAYQVKAGYDKAYPIEATNATGLNAKGLLTGTRTYHLDASGNYSVTAMYYDYRGRVVQTRSTNHLQGADITFNQYNFSGQIVQSLKEHTANGQSSVTELYTHTYDHAGRLKTTYYKINTKEPVLLVNNTYDELGRLIQKKRHNDLDTEEFDYNIRNWTTRLKSGDFEENLYYNSNLPTGATACYNGNIAASSWTYNTETYIYPYSYDQLNRLTNASGGNCNGNFETFSYDKQGNILELQRFKGYTPIDFLTMTYNGNQLKSVTDQYGSQNLYNVKEYNNKSNTTDEFSYDVNGNLIKDLDRDIVTIRYNLLNLPEIIQFKNGNQIRNLYDAGGRKLSTLNSTLGSPIVVPVGSIGNPGDPNNCYDYLTGSDYVGNIEYSFSNDCGDYQYDLSKVYNSEGYVDNFYYTIFNYYRRDHLGNIREVWRTPWSYGSTNYAAATIQRTQYYPSGLPWASNSGDNPWVQNKKYNGKEFVEMHGLDEYDFGHRGFYPAANIFTTRDWKAEETPDVSTYSYACNNPVRYRDENGDGPKDKVVGAAAAIVDNLTLGLVNLRGSFSYDDAADYNQGQDIGDALSIFMGGAEAAGGAGKAEAGVVVVATTGASGVGAVVGGGLTLLGATEMVHGTYMMTNGAKNLNSQKGRVDEANGNSKSSTKPQHNYDIKDTQSGKVVKTGVSGGKETKTGQSYRGNSQANKWNKQEGTPGRYKAEITNRVSGGKGAREKALKYEKVRANQVRNQLDPRKHQRP